MQFYKPILSCNAMLMRLLLDELQITLILCATYTCKELISQCFKKVENCLTFAVTSYVIFHCETSEEDVKQLLLALYCKLQEKMHLQLHFVTEREQKVGAMSHKAHHGRGRNMKQMV